MEETLCGKCGAAIDFDEGYYVRDGILDYPISDECRREYLCVKCGGGLYREWQKKCATPVDISEVVSISDETWAELYESLEV